MNGLKPSHKGSICLAMIKNTRWITDIMFVYGTMVYLFEYNFWLNWIIIILILELELFSVKFVSKYL